jgi:hypothetical protein
VLALTRSPDQCYAVQAFPRALQAPTLDGIWLDLPALAERIAVL